MLWNHFSRRSGLAAAFTLAAGLTSCAGSTSPGASQSPSSGSPSPTASSASPKPSIVAATNLDGITVVGSFQKLPTVTIPAPWAIDKSQAKVLIAGNGAEVHKDSLVQVHYWGGNGRTGQKFQESFSEGKPVVFPLENLITGFVNGLVGQKAGSRVLIGITGPDGYGAKGGNPQIGVQADDCLVFVVDIISVSASEPNGAQVTPPSGLPTVSGDLNHPVVTIPKDSPAPASLVVQPLIKGTGALVTSADTIRTNYAEYAWSTGKLVKQTYGDHDKGYKPQDGPLAQAVPAWQQALVNQPVGSRILIVAPPAQAYPSGDPRKGIKAGETMVFVVDILFAYKG